VNGNRRRSWHHRVVRRFGRGFTAPRFPGLTPLWVLGAGNFLAALAALLAGMLPVALVFSAAAWGCHACIRRTEARFTRGL